MVSETKWASEKLENDVFEIVKEEIQADDTFTTTTPLADVGLDSLALVRILVGIDESIGIWVEAELLTPEHLHDVRHLAACVADLQA